MNKPLKNRVTAQLCNLGWNAEGGTAIASKTFETAVGPKVAFAYLADFGADCDLLLTGDYQSEGRNCASTCMVLFPRNVEDKVLAVLVESYASQVDLAVAGTYAAGLHRLQAA